MSTQENISALESRQLELHAIIESFTPHAIRCAILSKKFSAQYPEEYAAFIAADEELSANELTLAELRAAREAEAEMPETTETETPAE